MTDEPIGFSIEECVDIDLIALASTLNISFEEARDPDLRRVLISMFSEFEVIEQPGRFPFGADVALERIIWCYCGDYKDLIWVNN